MPVTFRPLLCCALFALHACAVAAAPVDAGVAAGAEDRELFQALGEQRGVKQLVEKFLQQVTADTRTIAVTKAVNHPKLAAALSDQICALTGGPCTARPGVIKVMLRDAQLKQDDLDVLGEHMQNTVAALNLSTFSQLKLWMRLAPLKSELSND